MKDSGYIRCLDLSTGYLIDNKYTSIEEIFKLNFTEKKWILN